MDYFYFPMYDSGTILGTVGKKCWSFEANNGEGMSKFWSFCNNVIIESCQTYKREHILQFKKQPQQYNGDIYVCFKKTIGLI